MTFENILIINACVVAACMLVLWGVSLAIRDASIVDMFWGAGFVVISWCSLLLSGNEALPAWILTGMVTIWGLRLAAYLTWRNLGKGEDKRYSEMREKPNRNFALFSLVVIFGLQGLIMWIVSLPLQLAPTLRADANILLLVGGLLWLSGISFEAIGDFQLARFKGKPENDGKVLDSGLWHYTRHPNYFGDFLVWWGYWCFVCAIDLGAYWTAVGPALMTFCLVYFSGVMHLERTITHRRPEYADYIQRTSAFIPWPPQSSRESLPDDGAANRGAI